MRILDLANYIINKSINLNKPINWLTLNRILLLINYELNLEYGIVIISDKEKEVELNEDTNEISNIYINSVKEEYSTYGINKLISTKELKYHIDYDLLDKVDHYLYLYLKLEPGDIRNQVEEKVYSKK